MTISASQVDLSGVAADLIREFASFLRKNDRHLREVFRHGARAPVERSEKKMLTDADCLVFVKDAVTEASVVSFENDKTAAMCINTFAAICERCAHRKNLQRKRLNLKTIKKSL